MAPNLSSVVELIVAKQIFGYQHYMGEVSRLLIASPRLRLMETFILDIFSCLVGIDAPHFCLFSLYYYFIFHHHTVDGCHSVV